MARYSTIVTQMERLVARKIVYRLYPSSAQQQAFDVMLAQHQRLYNAALEQRIAAWRLGRHRVSFSQQCRELTELRADDPTYDALNAQSAQVTLKRLDLAFAAFFRRCKAGQTPGFPRFRSLERFSGWGYKTHGDGFRFRPGDGKKHGKLRLSGIGTIAARGPPQGQADRCSNPTQNRQSAPRFSA